MRPRASQTTAGRTRERSSGRAAWRRPPSTIGAGTLPAAHRRGTLTGMDDWDAVARAMLWHSPETQGLIRKLVRARQAVKVAVGAYVRVAALSEVADEPWRQQLRVSLARIQAIARRLAGDSAFTCESAALVRGRGLVERNADVHISGSARRQRGVRLPGVSINGTQINAEVRIVSHAHADASRHRSTCRGVPVVDSEMMLMDLCRYSPAVEALAVMCAEFRAASAFSRFRQAEGRRREAQVRHAFEQWVGAQGPRPGARRALMLVRAADAAIESVAEALMLWLLVSHRVVGFATQHPLLVDRRTYYPDFLFTVQRVVIEVDGYAKLGTTRAEVRRSVGSLLERAGALQAARWRVINVAARELQHPESLVARLRRLLPDVFPDARPADPQWL